MTSLCELLAQHVLYLNVFLPCVPPDPIHTMVNLQRFLYPRGWDVRLVRGVYAELLGTLLLSFIFNLTAVNSANAALAAGASYAVLGADLHSLSQQTNTCLVQGLNSRS